MIANNEVNIKIKTVRKPRKPDIEEDIDWICRSLGIFEPRDKKKTASKVFRIIIKATKKDEPVSSTEIADRVGVTRGAVINHLHKMMNSGLVVKRDRGYVLRAHNMFDTIGEIEEDIERMIRRMKRICDDIDKKVGLSLRRFTEEW